MNKQDYEQIQQMLRSEIYKSEKEKTKEKSERQWFSKFIIVFVIVINIAFTFYVLSIFREMGNEPSVLIGAWFAFTTGELWILGRIQTKKIEKTPDNYNERRSMYDDTGAK